MKVIKYPKDYKKNKKTMILGSFNSFHNGHYKLLEEARKQKNKIAILLIENIKILKRNDKKDFHSLDVRLQHLSNIGIDYAIVLSLDSEVMSKQGKDFAAELVEKYNIESFVVGEDFAMGKMASYKAKDLQSDFPTTIVKDLEINNKKISTSLLNEFVEFGEVDLVKKCSPFYFTINTHVTPKNTFKIDGLAPHSGVYAAWTIVNDVKYWSVVKIFKNDGEIIVPDLVIKNSGFDAQIEFSKQVRSIIRSEFNIFEKEDEIKVLNYLKNHL